MRLLNGLSLLAIELLLGADVVSAWGQDAVQDLLNSHERLRYQAACPDYSTYSKSGLQ